MKKSILDLDSKGIERGMQTVGGIGSLIEKPLVILKLDSQATTFDMIDLQVYSTGWLVWYMTTVLTDQRDSIPAHAKMTN